MNRSELPPSEQVTALTVPVSTIGQGFLRASTRPLWVSAGARNIQNIKQNKKVELQKLRWNWTNWQYQGFCISTAPLFPNNWLLLYCESPSWADAKCAWSEKCPRVTRKLLWKPKLKGKVPALFSSALTLMHALSSDCIFFFSLSVVCELQSLRVGNS